MLLHGCDSVYLQQTVDSPCSLRIRYYCMNNPSVKCKESAIETASKLLYAESGGLNWTTLKETLQRKRHPSIHEMLYSALIELCPGALGAHCCAVSAPLE